MKMLKHLLIVNIVLLSCHVSFCQTIIPYDSLNRYKDIADSLFNQEKYAEAILIYQNLAKSGDVSSAYELYEIFHNGFGVETNDEEAVKWLKIAMEEDSVFYNEILPKAKKNLFHEYEELLPINRAGVLIEKGGRLNMSSMFVGLIGETVGVVFWGVGVAYRYPGLVTTGRIVCGVAGVSSFVLMLVGNINIKKGGSILRNISISGNGINVRF